jgi:hypothetical protein
MTPEELSAFLLRRLTSDRTRDDWTRAIEGGWRTLLEQPLEVFLGNEVLALVEAHLEERRAVEWIRPVVRLFFAEVVREARADGRPIGRFVPDDARARLAGLAARKGQVDPSWIEHVFAQRAMEEVVTDTLYRALADFSTIVPRLVQSLTPSAIGKLAKLGGRATGGVGGKIVDELERRLEAEVKKFLDKGGRKALDGAARFTIEHIDDPLSVEARRNMVHFALDQSPAFHAASVDAEVLAALDEVVASVAARVSTSEDARRIARSVLERFRTEHGKATVRSWLAAIGVEGPPPFEAWAAATWPYVQTILATPEVRLFLDTLAREAVEEIEGR